MAGSLPALFEVTGVAAGDMLNIRDAPMAGAGLVGTFRPDARGVEVVGTSADRKWGLVNAGEGHGYVALRFLARQPGPDWFALQAPLTCSGTEPFWTLAFDPALPVAVYRTPDVQASFTVQARWPGQARQPVAGLALGTNRFLNLQPAICSDGMTDRQFGIAALLFLQGGTGPVTLSGCCTRQP